MPEENKKEEEKNLEDAVDNLANEVDKPKKQERKQKEYTDEEIAGLMAKTWDKPAIRRINGKTYIAQSGSKFELYETLKELEHKVIGTWELNNKNKYKLIKKSFSDGTVIFHIQHFRYNEDGTSVRRFNEKGIDMPFSKLILPQDKAQVTDLLDKIKGSYP